MASSTVPASSKAEPRSARPDARMPARVRELVVHAARLRGRSVSEFVVSAAEEAAKRIIEEDAVFRVSTMPPQGDGRTSRIRLI